VEKAFNDATVFKISPGPTAEAREWGNLNFIFILMN